MQARWLSCQGGGAYSLNCRHLGRPYRQGWLGIPEDDPRNPAVIADNVGDNAGDVAGMGADLFDSNVAAMAAALVVAQSLTSPEVNTAMVFCMRRSGSSLSIIGIACARIGKKGNPTRALNFSTYITTAIFIVLTAGATAFFEGFEWRIFFASTIGLWSADNRNHHQLFYRRHSPLSAAGAGLTLGLGLHHSVGCVLRFYSALPAMVGIAPRRSVHIKSASRRRRVCHVRNFYGGGRNALNSRHDNQQ